MDKIPCMICATEIKMGICGGAEENILSGDWEGCTIDIQGGFSSDFDSQYFHGVVCTKCMNKCIPNLFKVKNHFTENTKYEYFPLGQNLGRNMNWGKAPEGTSCAYHDGGQVEEDCTCDNIWDHSPFDKKEYRPEEI